MPPTVSVIITTYNRAGQLKTAIESVLAQTFTDYELIIADDGSTDETREVVSSFQNEENRSKQIQYFHQPNQGKSVALNHAVDRANGEWIAFLDSDDYWLPDKLEAQFQAIEQFGDSCGACFTDGQFVNNPHMQTTAFRFFGRQYDEAMGVLKDAVRTFAKTPAGVSVVTLLCRKEFVEKIGGFDPALRFTEDYDFLFRLATVTDYCFVNRCLVIIDRTKASDRHAGASAIWDRVDFRLQTEQQRYEKWLKLSDILPADVRRTIRRRLREVHSAWANWYLEKHDYQRAENALSTAANYEFSVSVLAKRFLTRGFPELTRQIVVKRGGFNAEVF